MRPLIRILLLALAILAPVIASTAAPSYAETRVWGFEVEEPARARAQPTLSQTCIEAYPPAYEGFVVGCSPVPRETADDFAGTPNPVLGKTRAGSALKTDSHHAFPDLVDNFASEAKQFKIPTRGPGGKIVRESELSQVEGSLNGRDGVFEWVVDEGRVTHRRFIPGGTVTGKPNQIPGAK